MVEIKAITYEQARTDFLKAEMEKAQNRMKFWQTKIKKAKNAIAEMEAHDNASNAGWEYNFYKDALEALENNRFKYETGFVRGFESAQPKWISVEDRFPGDPLDGVGDVVELLIDKGDVKEVLPGYYDHDEKDWIIYFGDPSGLYLSKYFSWWRVIKWRSLPEPPKEE